MKDYELNFDGYYREVNKSGLPEKAGVYCVYTCKYNPVEKNLRDLFLIYIGESENINERHKDNSHEHYEDFKLYLENGETLCYSYTLIPNEEDRKRCEAALIYEMQPPINEQGTDGFNYSPTHIVTSGCNSGLENDFIVE